MAYVATIPPNRIVDCGRYHVIDRRNMNGNAFARFFEKFEKGKPVFALAGFKSRIDSEMKYGATAAFWSDYGKVLLCLPPLALGGDDVHKQKYILAGTEGSNYFFSLPQYFGKAHVDLFLILLGFEKGVGMEGGGFLSIWRNMTPDLNGMSRSFNVNDVSMEARNALAPFLKYWDDFTEYRKSIGILV